MMRKYSLIFALLILAFQAVPAQSMRSLVNDGVDLYKGKKFTDSEINFRKGVEKTPDSYEANFNLGDAYYKQQRYDEAVNSFQSALGLASTSEQKGHIYHNIGNSLLKSQKLKESIEAYKKALRFNPDDADTKYNLSYALQQQKNQQQQQQNKNNQNNKDQQQQQNQDKQNQDNKNQDKNQQKQDQQQPPQNQQSQQDNLKQKEQKISKQEAERILQALKNNEQDLQKKLRKQKGVPVKTDKDW